MPPSGKSKSGRGGISKKRDSSGNRVSSSSSTHTATDSPRSVNLTPLPNQYPYAPQNSQSRSPPFQPPSIQPPPSQPTPFQPPPFQPPLFQPPPSQTPPSQPPPFQPSLAQSQPPPPPQNHDPVSQQPHDEQAIHQQPNHPQNHLSLEDLLTMRGRAELFPRLSPRPDEGLWFDRDEQKLVKRVSKILKDKFDGPYYSWSVTPTDQQDRYFTQLAYHYTWDPMITPLVRYEFDSIAQRRLKDLVSHVRTTRTRPRWIRKTLWEKMEEYWKTDEAKERSTNASTNRNSDREGLGPHKHVGGPRSFAQIARDMEVELQRPVSIGEVFKKTHTRKDGTYVDEKAKLIGESYEKNLQARLTQIGTNSTNSDGTPEVEELTTDEMNTIFIQSTIDDERGNPYGLGRLSRIHGKGKEKGTSSSTIYDLQEQLKAAQRRIEEQEAENKRRDEELARREVENQQHKNQMDIIVKYLKEKDPAMAAWMELQTHQAPPSTTPATRLHNSTPSSSTQ